MGMAAEAVAIGPYAESLREVLSRPQRLYDGLADGVVVLDTLFYEYGILGSSASRALAAALGVDRWDFNTHHFDPIEVDLPALRALVGDREVDRFVALRSAGFRFVFCPNG